MNSIKKKLALLFVALFICGSVLSFYPVNTVNAEGIFNKIFKWADSDDTSSDDTPTEEELQKEIEENEEAVELEYNRSILNSDDYTMAYSTIADCHNNYKSLPDSTTSTIKGMKTYYTGNKDVDAYMVENSDDFKKYGTFTIGVGAATEAEVKNKGGCTSLTTDEAKKAKTTNGKCAYLAAYDCAKVN
ncbi:MAG: hypothetical protein K5656_08550 [Lachnospiraceae bacterium]|nr:hypothetical protein [Lachnospiraceae bacterium]